MNWWEKQISLGWKGPTGRPRGSEDAAFPLRTGARYRVSMNPAKSHLLLPGSQHAYCGLTLAPEDGWLIDSGYDEYYWIVEDERVESNQCKPCSKWQGHWRQSGQKGSLATDSPISNQEWAATVGTETMKDKAKLDTMAEVVVSWFGGGARIQ